MDIETLLKRSDYDQVIKYLEHKICNNSEAYNESLQLALLYLTSPGEFYPRSISILKNVLNKLKNDIKAILLLGYIEYIHIGEISKDCFALAINCLNDDKYIKNEYFNYLYILKCFYYEGNVYKYRNETEYINSIKQALTIDNTFVSCYLGLARYYEKRNDYNKALDNLNLALKSIHHIYDENEYVSPISFVDFFEENYSNRKITQVNHLMLLEKKEYLTKQVT